MSGTVLVVAHSNTAPLIVTALTGEPVAKLCETSFGHAFVVNTATKAVVRLRYGEPDSQPSQGCH
jgi:hypothetical protein